MREMRLPQRVLGAWGLSKHARDGPHADSDASRCALYVVLGNTSKILTKALRKICLAPVVCRLLRQTAILGEPIEVAVVCRVCRHK